MSLCVADDFEEEHRLTLVEEGPRQSLLER